MVYADGDYGGTDVRTLSCTLVDDGAAVVDSGWTDIADGVGRVELAPHGTSVVDIDGIGPVLVDAMTDVESPN